MHNSILTTIFRLRQSTFKDVTVT